MICLLIDRREFRSVCRGLQSVRQLRACVRLASLAAMLSADARVCTGVRPGHTWVCCVHDAQGGSPPGGAPPWEVQPLRSGELNCVSRKTC